MVPLAATWLLHGAPQAAVPHWVVVLVAVPLLWMVIGCAVVVLDRLVGRVEN